MNIENQDCGQDESLPLSYSFVDQWLLTRLQQTITAVTEALDTYRFDMLAQTLYEFVWNEYCDWYVELAKTQLQQGNEAQQRATRRTLVRVLETVLRLLHPIMPFISEELWQTIAPLANAKHTDSIMLAPWPQADAALVSTDAMEQMSHLQDLINTVRNLRGEMGLAMSVKVPLLVESSYDLSKLLPYLPLMARLSEVQQTDQLPENDDAPVAVCRGARLMLKVEVDKAAERIRLQKEAEKLQKKIDKIEMKLAKPGYTDKAPAHLVEKDRVELAQLQDKMNKITLQLSKYQ